MNRKNLKRFSTVFFISFAFVGLASAGSLTFSSGSNTFHLSSPDAYVDLMFSDTWDDVTVSDYAVNSSQGDFKVNRTSGSDTLNVNLSQWDLSATQGKKAFIFNASAPGSEYRFSITGLQKNKDYIVQRDGKFHAYRVPGSDKRISFTAKKWSTHKFTGEMDEEKPMVTLSTVDDNPRNKEILERADIKIKCSSSDELGVKSTKLTVFGPNGDTQYNHTCNTQFGSDPDKTAEVGTYTVRYEATDYSQKTNFTTVKFLVNARGPQQNAGGGGGGGGGGGALPQPENPQYSNSWPNGGQNFEADVSQDIPSMNKVIVQTSKQVDSFDLNVEELQSPPAPASDLENVGIVYDIDAGASDDQISSGIIEFRVDKSWADQYDRVILQRNTEDGWQKLETQRTGEDGDQYIYTANTPGFSYFAVTGENDQDTTTSDQQDNQTTTDSEDSQEDQGPVAGNGVCEAGESWRDTDDCSAPDAAVAAQEVISRAEAQVEEGTSAYETLQEARDAYNEGRFQEAQQFAQLSIDQTERGPTGRFLSDNAGFTGLAVIVILAVLFYVYTRQEKIKGKLESMK